MRKDIEEKKHLIFGENGEKKITFLSTHKKGS